MTILLQLVGRIIDEAFRSRDVVSADGTREAVRVKTIALDFEMN